MVTGTADLTDWNEEQLGEAVVAKPRAVAVGSEAVNVGFQFWIVRR